MLTYVCDRSFARASFLPLNLLTKRIFVPECRSQSVARIEKCVPNAFEAGARGVEEERCGDSEVDGHPGRGIARRDRGSGDDRGSENIQIRSPVCGVCTTGTAAKGYGR